MRTWGSRKRDDGAAVVETALCICFLVLPLTFAVIAYAYMLSFRQSLSQAASEGARAAAVSPAGTTKPAAEAVAKTAIKDAFGGLANDLACGQNNLTCDFVWTDNCGTNGVGTALKCLSVTVSYPYRDNPLLPNLPGMGFLLPKTVAYKATAQVG